MKSIIDIRGLVKQKPGKTSLIDQYGNPLSLPNFGPRNKIVRAPAVIGHVMCMVEVPIWYAWTIPEGPLPRHIEAQALMTYNIKASQIIYESEKPQYDGEPPTRMQFAALLKTYAKMYSVDPHDMVKYWPEVDKVRKSIGLLDSADLPRWARYPDTEERIV